MSQVILEFSNQNDLDLLLSFAKRLKVVSIQKHTLKKATQDNRANIMKQAARDLLFLADVREVTDDFAFGIKPNHILSSNL